MERKKVILAVALAAIMLFLAACGGGGPISTTIEPGGPGAGQKTGENVLTVAMNSDLSTLDPGRAYEVYSNMMFYAAYDYLVKQVGEGVTAPQKDLATDIKIDEAGTTYTFTLRDGVKFTSGNPMTSADVKWSVERAINLKDNAAANADIVESVTCPDDKTVVFKIKQPDASFLSKMTTNTYAVLDSKFLTEKGGSAEVGADQKDTANTYLDTASAGSGQYIVKSWTPKADLVFEKNPNYWGEQAKFDRIIIKEVPDGNAEMQMLERNEVDVAFSLTPEQAKQMKDKSGVKVINAPTTVISFLGMNADPNVNKEIANPKVQQAIRYAIDYEGLKQLCGDGALLPMANVPDVFIGGLPRAQDHMTDVEKAKQLLTEAGYPNGFETTLKVAEFESGGMKWSTIGEKIQQDLAKAGITVKLESGDVTAVIENYRNGKEPFFVMHWSPDYHELNNQLVFLPDEVVGKRLNWAAKGNEELVAIGKRIAVELDETKRKADSEAMQKSLADNSPYAYLLQHPRSFAVRDNMTNVEYNDLCKLNLCAIGRAAQ